MLEKQNSIAGRTLTSSSPLLSLKPRQVLLNMKSKDNQTSSYSSASEMDKKKIVLHSIYQFLQRNELPKAAKNLLSQAKLDLNEPLNGYEIDLEEVCFKHLELLQLDRISKTTEDKKGEKSKSVANNVGNGQSEAFPEEKCKDTASDGTGKEQPNEKKKKKTKSANDSEITEGKENTIEIAPEGKGPKSKEKKKKSISQNGDMEELEKEKLGAKSTQGGQPVVNNVGNGQLEALPEEKCDDTKSDVTGEEQPKEKKKKKSKSAIGSQVTEAKEDTTEIAPEGKVTKSKDKKKKSINGSQNGVKEELEKEKSSTKSTQGDNQNAEEVMNKEKKESKKRKRLASRENDHSVDNMADTEKTKENDPVLKENESLGSDVPSRKKNRTGDNGEARSCDVSEQLNVEEKGNNEKTGDKSSGLKNMKKPHHGSAEPTTVKAFQRVKVDDVVFTDERLQDNSYWAKDGADTGYGAKAQEILGQVRGKDFRHEKTKKKRGSYRGGQIDLQSHSVKFNYSDDE